VQGVMGGGDRGVVGERGHLSLRLDMGVRGVLLHIGEATGVDLKESNDLADARLWLEATRTMLLRVETGPLVKLKRPGVLGVAGVDRAGDTSGDVRAGIW
jgi:hypothetical protein